MKEQADGKTGGGWVDDNSGSVLKAGLIQAAASGTAVSSLPVGSLAYTLGGQLTGWWGLLPL